MALTISLVVCIIGALVYAITENAKLQALSLHAFWVGLLVTLLSIGGQLASITR